MTPTPEPPPRPEPGGEVHREHPFLPPEQDRGVVRRLRGRLPSPVTLWTAAVPEGSSAYPARAGLPVSSVLVADGEPGRVVGLVDPDSDLWTVLADADRFVVHVLDWEHRALADAFGEQAPAPGGPFRIGNWEDTAWGPHLVTLPTWAGCTVAEVRRLGWGFLVTGELEYVALGDDAGVLVRHRGRYRTLG